MGNPVSIGDSFADFATLLSDPPIPGTAKQIQLYAKLVGGVPKLYLQTSAGPLDITTVIAGALLAANNLSDVPDKPTALVNLGAQPFDSHLFSNIPVGNGGSVIGANYTCVAADAEHMMVSQVNGVVFTIPADAAVPYPFGTALSFCNFNVGTTMSIAINGSGVTDFLFMGGNPTAGTRTLAQMGFATAVRMPFTSPGGYWLISGVGLT